MLNKLKIALNDSKESSFLDSVKFVFADVHRSMTVVLQNLYKDAPVCGQSEYQGGVFLWE